MLLGNRHQPVEAAAQCLGLRRHVVHLRVMRQVHCRRRKAHQAIDRGVHLDRVELRRRSGRQDELTDIAAVPDIELAVRQTEHVAGKNRAAFTVDHANMVFCMPRGIDAQQFAPPQFQHQPIVGVHDTLGRNGQNIAVDRVNVRLTINSGDAGHQPGRLGHVARTARMHHQLGLGQFAHQRAGTAGVVEVDVAEDDVIDRIATQAQLIERRQHIRQRIVAAGIDQRHPPIVDNQVDRRQDRTDIAGVKGMNAVLVSSPVHFFPCHPHRKHA